MKVKVYSTQMGEKSVETNATTWGQLQNDLRSAGISFNKMKAVIGETKHTLEADGASLPGQDFTLFLMNKKTKAGTHDVSDWPYKRLRGQIKLLIERDGDSAKDHFNVGKNYTTKSTDILRSLLTDFSGELVVDGGSPAPKKETKKETKKAKVEIPAKEDKNVADVTQAVAKAKKAKEEKKKEDNTIQIENEDLKVLDSHIAELEELDFSEISVKHQSKLETAIELLKVVSGECEDLLVAAEKKRQEEEAKRAKEEEERKAKEAEEQRIAEEKKKSEAELKAQYDDIFSEFSDVKR